MSRKTNTEKNDSKESINSSINSEVEEIIYNALGSQVRRDIISFIKSNEKVGFLELKENFHTLKVGSLYHQLNMMKDLWHQDVNKKYQLTEIGKVAFNLMIVSKDQIAVSNVKLDESGIKETKRSFKDRFFDFVEAIFLPKKIFQYLVSEPLRTFIEGLIIIGALLYFSIDSQFIPIGFYPYEVEDWYFALIGILSLWLFLGLMSSGFKSLFYRRKYNPLKLLTLVPFTLIPSLITIFFIWLQTKVEATFLFMDGQLLAIFSQIWSLPLLTTAVSQAEELTINRSSLCVLFTFYLVYIVAFVLLGIN